MDEDLNWVARLQFRAVKALRRRVAQTPAFQERQRRGRLADPVLAAARVFGASPDDDETVAARLRRHTRNPEAARYALLELERRRDRVTEGGASGPRDGADDELDFRLREGFDDDRVYRLLYAVVHSCKVPEVDPARREEFAAQDRLSRRPLREAFADLADRAPRLRVLEREIVEGRLREEADKQKLPHSGLIDERISQILRSADASRDPVLHSNVAVHAASLYLLVLIGEMPGDLDTPVNPATRTERG